MMNLKKYNDLEEQLLSDADKQVDKYYCSSFTFGKKFYFAAICVVIVLAIVGDDLIQRADRVALQYDIIDGTEVKFEQEIGQDTTNLRRSGGRGGRGSGDPRIAGFILGILMIGFALPMAWFNEQNQVKICKLIHKGEKAVVPNVDINIVNPNLNFKLVHCVGQMTSNTPTVDENFGIYQGNAIYLERTVECFQTIETEHKDSDGTTYTYSQEWTTERNASDGFHTPPLVPNPTDWPVETAKIYNPSVNLGQFFLPESQKEQFDHKKPIDLNPNFTNSII